MLGSTGGGSDSLTDQFNINYGHAYTILGAYLVNLKGN